MLTTEEDYRFIRKEYKEDIQPFIINSNYSMFSFSDEAYNLLVSRGNVLKGSSDYILRTLPDAIALVENDPKFASNSSRFKIVSIPTRYYECKAYRIHEYDGLERINLDENVLKLSETEKNVKTFSIFLNRVLNDPSVAAHELCDSLKSLYWDPTDIPDIKQLVERASLLPGVGSLYLEGKKRFESAI
jgi:hypothetical protein